MKYKNKLWEGVYTYGMVSQRMSVVDSMNTTYVTYCTDYDEAEQVFSQTSINLGIVGYEALGKWVKIKVGLYEAEILSELLTEPYYNDKYIQFTGAQAQVIYKELFDTTSGWKIEEDLKRTIEFYKARNS